MAVSACPCPTQRTELKVISQLHVNPLLTNTNDVTELNHANRFNALNDLYVKCHSSLGMNEQYHKNHVHRRCVEDYFGKGRELNSIKNIAVLWKGIIYVKSATDTLQSTVARDWEQKGRVGYYAISFILSSPKEMSLNQKVVKRHKKDYLLLK